MTWPLLKPPAWLVTRSKVGVNSSPFHLFLFVYRDCEAIWLCGHSFQGDSIDKVFFNFQIADWKSLHTHFCWRHYENTLNTQLWPIWVPRSALYDVCNLWPVTQLCRTPVFSSMNRSDITYSPGCCEITVGFMHVKHLEWCLTWHKHSVCTLSSFFHSHSWF